MSSSGVVVPACSSPRDFHATSNVALPEVSSVVVPEPVNRSPFHSVLALLTTGLGMVSPSSQAVSARRAGGAPDSAVLLIPPHRVPEHTGRSHPRTGGAPTSEGEGCRPAPRAAPAAPCPSSGWGPGSSAPTGATCPRPTPAPSWTPRWRAG